MDHALPTHTAPWTPAPPRLGGTRAVPTPVASGPGQVVDSGALLQGQVSVAIRHHGVVYRLQATKMGKLILTK